MQSPSVLRDSGVPIPPAPPGCVAPGPAEPFARGTLGPVWPRLGHTKGGAELRLRPGFELLFRGP